MQPTTCTISTGFTTRLCRSGANTEYCYDVYIATNAVPVCGDYVVIMTTHDRALADQLVARNPPYTRSCYYDPNNQCYPSFTLADVYGTLVAGCVFTGLAALCLVFVVIKIKIDKRLGYNQIEDNENLESV